MAENGEKYPETFSRNRRLTIWLICLFAFLFIAIGAIVSGYYLERINTRKQTRQKELTAIVDSKASQIFAWRNARLGDGKIIQNTPLYFQSIQEYLIHPTSQQKQILINWMENFRAVYSYQTFFLVDPAGKVILQDEQHLEPLGSYSTALIQMAIQKNQEMLSDLFIRDSSNDIRMDVLVPIVDINADNSSPIAVFILRIDPNIYLYPLIQTWPVLSNSGETVLFHQVGDQLVYLNELRFEKNTALKLSFPVDSPDLPAAIVLRGQAGVIEGKDYRGVPVVFTGRQIPDSDWFIVSKEDSAEVFADVRSQGWFLGIILSIVIAAYGLTTYSVIRRERQIFEKRLLEVEIVRQRVRQSYNLLFTIGNDIVVVFDENGNITDVNDRAVETYGYSQAELLNMNGKLLRISEQRDMFFEMLENAKTKDGQRADEIHQKKDGTQFPVEVSTRYFLVEGKGYFLNITRDISERKESEKAINEANKKLELLFEILPVGVTLLNEKGEVVSINPALEKILGVDQKDLLGAAYKNQKYIRSDGSLMPPEEFASNRILAGEERVDNIEAGVVKEDGSVVWTNISATSMPYSDPKVVVITSDITANKQMINEIKENLGDLQSIIDTSPFSVITTDLNGKVTLWNKASEQIFGWKSKEVLGKQLPYFVENDTQTLDATIKKVLSTSGPSRYEGVRKRKDGTIIEVSATSIPIRDYRGEVKGLLGILSDVTEQKKIEAANQQIAEERDQLLKRMRLQFDRLPIGFILADEKLNVLDWNPQAEKIFGYSREEAVGKNQFELIIPKDQQSSVENIVKKTMSGKQTEVLTNENVTKEGRRILVEWHNTSLWDEFGNPAALLTMAIDVTEKVKAERLLRESEEKQRAFFDSSVVGTLFGDINGHIFSANNELLRIIGYTREDLLKGKIRWDKITPPECHVYDEKAIEQASQRGSCDPYEKQYIRKDGSRVWVLVGFVLLGKERINSVAFILDITERKQAEHEIRRKQELLNLTGQIGQIGGWEFDVASGKGTWTDEVARIHDLNPAVPTSRDIGLNYYTPASRSIIEKAIQEAIDKAKPYDLELELITAKGIHKLVRTVGQPEIEGWKVVRLRGIFQDITALKQAEAEITKLNDELEQRVKDRTAELTIANQELESFSYSVSHDLRAPIRAIDGFSQIIMDDFSTSITPDILRYLQLIRSNTHNMGELVDDLLAVSRLGRQAIQRNDVDTEKLVKGIIEEIRAETQGRRIEFRIGKLPDCSADEVLLRQVYYNLIANAVKFTRNRKKALIEIGTCKTTPLTPDGLPLDRTTCYFVRDNGVGFDMRYYDKMFKVFNRLHKTEDYEGTGVGLAIVKRVIEKHGGVVWAESVIDSGSTFYFTIGKGKNGDKSN